MKNHSTVIGSIISFCIFLISCKHEELVNSEIAVQGQRNEKLVFSNASFDPAKPGSFNVMSDAYTISDVATNSAGKVYYPYQEVVTPGPLVLFLHGNSTGGYKNYSQICRHLASHGFYVASISWPSSDYKNPGKVEIIKNSIVNHINYLYSNNLSPLKGRITNDMVLMGHSRGGAAIVSYAAEIEKIKNVQSIIALAPSPADMDMLEKFSLNTVTSFLVLYGSSDVDVYGGWDKNVSVKRSGFKFFDDAGYDWGNIEFTKDMVFIKGLNHGTFCDTNNDGLSGQGVDALRQHLVKGYINAFLQLHINKKEGYNQFFKYQVKIPSMDPSIKVSQQHVDDKKLVLTNFENENADKITHYAGKISYPVSSVNVEVNKAALIDETSFHGTQTMAIAWQQNNSEPDPVINFAFKNKIDLSMYKNLSIRAGLTLYYLNELGKEQSFYVQLLDDNGIKSTLVTVTIPPSFQPSGLQSYMQSFLLPLYQFKGVDIKKIKSVSLHFVNKNYNQGRIMVDNMEFYK